MKILVIDRNKTFCQLISEYLELQGYQVLASDGIEFQELSFDIQIVIIDVLILNNHYSKLREIIRRVPFIVMRTCAVSLLPVMEGNLPTITKPFKLEELERLIKDVLLSWKSDR